MTDNLNSILKSLNDEQKSAVRCTEGPVLIVAGAGSGKTRVLTSRIAYLLSQGAEPSEILALTFTKKAAAEMKERIALMVGKARARRLVMGTFHSVFIRFLRDYAGSLGYPGNFTIYDTSDSVSAIKTCLKELNLDDKTYKPKEVLSRISMMKNNLVTWQAYLADASTAQADARSRKPMLGELYHRYQEKLKAAGVMDFDDILLNMNYLLRDNPEALADIADRFAYIMVDEYQDTNKAQYIILRRLSNFRRNICVVGDDSQSIYAFRGAKIENILNFKKDYPECRTFRLECNYRSTKTIVDAANSLIAHNEGRIPKDCYSSGPDGEKIRLLDTGSEQDEAMRIASEIMSRIRSDHAEYRDFALLYRTNSQSRALEEQLRRRNIPYMIYSGNSFFDRAEVKDLMAYFKLCVNPMDDESFKRAVNRPARGIGATTLQNLESLAAADGTSLFKAGFALPKVKPFCEMIDSLSMLVRTTDAYELARRIADDSGLYAFFKSDSSIEGQSRTANIEELVNSVAAYVEEKDIVRPQDMVVKSVVNKSGNKVFIIQSIDRQMDPNEISPENLRGYNVILTDDGVDNPTKLQAAITWLKPARVDKVILAVPVISVPALDVAHVIFDELHVLGVAANYLSTDHYYDEDDKPDDQMARRMIQVAINNWK